MNTHYQTLLINFIVISSTIATATSQGTPPQNTNDSSHDFLGITIYVDDSNSVGPWNGSRSYPYQHIADGIIHATDSDTVYIFNGLYNETLLINKSILVRGQQQDNTIIDAGGTTSALRITSDNVRIQRFTIRNSGGYTEDAGITVTSKNVTITECTIYRTRTGIAIHNASGVTITNSKFYTNGYGITSAQSATVAINACTFYHNGIGVSLYDTHCTTITNSYADTNGIGFLAEHSTNIEITKTGARDNDDNEGGMFFSHCAYLNIIDCNIQHNGFGIDIVNSSCCYLTQCNFSLNTHCALKLKYSLPSIILSNCMFTENLRYGIYAENSTCSISWSHFNKNSIYGLYALSSTIDARYNWWGFRTGPAHTGLALADRGTWNPRDIFYYPWLTFPLPEGVGPTWNLEKTFEKPVYTNPWPEHLTLPGDDTDGDGAPDWWEQQYGYNPAVTEDHQNLDPDNDSLNNLEECFMDPYGANPFHRDVFLELDWTTSLTPNATNKPRSQEIGTMIAAFERHNITLHVGTGALGGGEEIPPISYISYANLINYYWDYFLHNTINNPRQRIFHYGLLCDYSEGPGFAFIGWDNLNCFVIAAQFLEDTYPLYTRAWLAMTSAMHETGHTFGLIATKYSGIDNQAAMKPYYKEFWLYRNYKSILNYLYTFSIMDYSDGTHGRGDFNDWGNLNFSFFKNTQFNYSK